MNVESQSISTWNRVMKWLKELETLRQMLLDGVKGASDPSTSGSYLSQAELEPKSYYSTGSDSPAHFERN